MPTVSSHNANAVAVTDVRVDKTLTTTCKNPPE